MCEIPSATNIPMKKRKFRLSSSRQGWEFLRVVRIGSQMLLLLKEERHYTRDRRMARLLFDEPCPALIGSIPDDYRGRLGSPDLDRPAWVDPDSRS